MNSRFLLIPILLILPTVSFAAGSCVIDAGPTPEFARYLKETQAKVNQIQSFVAKHNTCKGTQGSFSAERRFFDTIDRIEMNTPGYSDAGSYSHLITDFAYQVKSIAQGGGSRAVMAHGNLIRNLEVNTILPAIQSAASACALDVPFGTPIEGITGNTPEEALANLLKANKNLEAYYKNVVVSETLSTDIYQTLSDPLSIEIRENYIPTATASCASPSGTKEIITEKMKKIEQNAVKTFTQNDDWKTAIRLFRGENDQVGDYYALQRRLLSAELARQGVSKSARDMMMSTLSCVQGATSKNDSMMDTLTARKNCQQLPIVGTENLIGNLISKSYARPSTITQYIAQTATIKEVQLSGNRAGKMYETVNTILIDNTSDANDIVMTDLVNLHAKLVQTNKNITEEIPKMQKACRNGQPKIPCPK